jgi:uncharacterized phage-associated protein
MISGVQLVEYLLKKYGPLPQKKLQKLAYLAEIQYIKKHGDRLSDLSFKKYYYGPYSVDIRNIEDLDENIVIREEANGLYSSKVSELIDKESINPIDDNNLSQQIDSALFPYCDKTGAELQEEADKTEPFLEAENFNDPIDLDGYAWYYSKVNSDDFWEAATRKDDHNKKNHVYGKHIVKEDSELNSLFS